MIRSFHAFVLSPDAIGQSKYNYRVFFSLKSVYSSFSFLSMFINLAP